MSFFQHLTVHEVVDLFAYWIVFWTVLGALLPPLDRFQKPHPNYATFLGLVNYWSSLNNKAIAAKIYGTTGQVEFKTGDK